MSGFVSQASRFHILSNFYMQYFTNIFIKLISQTALTKIKLSAPETRPQRIFLIHRNLTLSKDETYFSDINLAVFSICESGSSFVFNFYYRIVARSLSNILIIFHIISGNLTNLTTKDLMITKSLTSWEQYDFHHVSINKIT